MKFSIIIPLYNKAPYIRKALESVFAQTYTDYELIVVDDGSTDDSASIVQQFIDEILKVKGEETSRAVTSTYNLSPITYKLSVRLITQSNAGVSAARNNGVAASSGDYIAFLDADDWWEPTYLEKMAKLIEDYPEAGLYASNYVYYKPGKTRVAVNNIETGYFNYPKAYYEGGAMPAWTGAVLIPRKIYNEVGGFRTHLWMAEDFDLWIRIAIRYNVAFLNEPLAYYNQVVELKWRAIGKLYPPIRQFAFDSDYLIPHQENDIAIKKVVDRVKIICLKQYYISKKYHLVAKKELMKIDLNEYRNETFASYLWQPLWKLRIESTIYNVYNFLKQIK